MEEKTYLPLYWGDAFGKATKKMLKFLNVQELEIMSDTSSPKIQRNLLLRRKPSVAAVAVRYEKDGKTFAEIASNCLLMYYWNKSRQIFKVDKDFLSELIKTDTLHFSKGAWKYLPCNAFYVDISESTEISKKVKMKGFYVTLTENPKTETWLVRILKINGYQDEDATGIVYNAWNQEKTIQIQNNDVYIQELINYPASNSNKIMAMSEEMRETERMTSIVIVQILTYLSSVEPDIRQEQPDDESSGQNLQKTNSKNQKQNCQPKQPSVWNVGFRFGSAFRKWSSAGQTSSESVSTGKKIRPHHRNAHWQRYWYGKKDGSEERFCRPKWVADCFVNLNMTADTEKLPAVIHEVKGES